MILVEAGQGPDQYLHLYDKRAWQYSKPRHHLHLNIEIKNGTTAAYGRCIPRVSKGLSEVYDSHRDQRIEYIYRGIHLKCEEVRPRCNLGTVLLVNTVLQLTARVVCALV